MKNRKPKTKLRISARPVKQVDSMPADMVDYYFEGKYIGNTYRHFDGRLMKSAGLNRFINIHNLA
jgi:hypothetical protein